MSNGGWLTMARRVLGAWLKREAFDPTLAGVLVNPFYLARRDIAKYLRALAPQVQGRVLDVGCGQKPYVGFFSASEYVGLELDTPENRRKNNADRFYDGRHFPFADFEFDTVLCSQVLEHIFEPSDFLAEIHRVLRPHGVLVLTAPFVWDEHEQPYDYARYSSFGLKYLLSKHGFRVETEQKTLADVSALFQLGNAYLYKVTRTRFALLNLALTAVLMAPVSLLGALLGRVLPGNPDLYLDNIVLLRKEG